jgi:hypothetical protein
MQRRSYWACKFHFAAMRSVCIKLARIGRIGTAALSLRQKHAKRDVLRSWKLEYALACRNKGVLEAAARRLHNRTLSNAFNKWAHVAAELRYLREVVGKSVMRLLNKALVRCFEEWIGWSTAMASHRFKGAALEKHLRRRRIVRIWEKWTHRKQLERRHRVGTADILKRLENRGVLAAFNQWREYALEAVQTRHLLTGVVARLKYGKAARLVSAWGAHTRRKLEQRRKETDVAAMRRRRRTTGVWVHWKAKYSWNVRVARVLTGFLGKMSKGGLRKVFNSWKCFSVPRFRAMRKGFQRRKLFAADVLRSGFTRWRSWASFRAKVRTFVRSKGVFRVDAIMRSHFTNWQSSASRNNRITRKLRVMLGGKELQTKSRVFTKWQEWVSHSLANKAKVGTSVGQ